MNTTTTYDFQLCADYDPTKLPKNGVVERKRDGMAALATAAADKATLWNRDHRNITHKFPEVVPHLPRNCVLVGELCRISSDDDESFYGDGILLRAAVENRLEISLRSKALPCTLVVHDILTLQGQDLRDASLSQRRKALELLIPEEGLGMREGMGPALIRDPQFPLSEWDALVARVQAEGWEGLVIKDADAPYRATRGAAWMKWKNWVEADFPLLRFENTQGDRGHDGFVIYVRLPDGQEQRVVVNDVAAQGRIRSGHTTARIEYLVGKGAHTTSDGRLRQPHFKASS